MTEVKRILLVEDDLIDQELILQALGECGLADDVKVIADGQQAVNYLLRLGEYKDRPEGLPTVIMLNPRVAGVHGLDLLRRMKTHRTLQPVPVVVLAIQQDEKEAEECYKLGANAFISKRTNFHDFMETIRIFGLFWANVNEPPLGSVRPVHLNPFV